MLMRPTVAKTVITRLSSGETDGSCSCNMAPGEFYVENSEKEFILFISNVIIIKNSTATFLYEKLQWKENENRPKG